MTFAGILKHNIHLHPEFVISMVTVGVLQVTTIVENLRKEVNTCRESPLADSTCLRLVEDVDAPMSIATMFEIQRRCDEQDWGRTVFCQAMFPGKERTRTGGLAADP